MILRALRAGWDVPPKAIADAQKLIDDVLGDRSATDRELIAVAKILATIDAEAKAPR